MIYQARRRLPALLISPKIYHCGSKLASILYYVCTILLKSRDWNNEPELPVCLWGPDGTDYSASEVPRTGGVSHVVETTAFLQVADGDYKRYRYIGGSGKEVLAQ